MAADATLLDREMVVEVDGAEDVAVR